MSTFNGWNVISIPTSPSAPKSMEWMLSDVQGSVKSPFSLQQQIFSWSQAVLAVSLSYQPMLPPQAAAWEAFLMNCYGIGSVFMFGDPLRLTPQTPGATGGTASAAASGATTLTISSSGMQVGDWVQVGVRMYRLVNGSGGTFGIWPPVREAITSGTSVVVNGAQGLFRLLKNDRKYTVKDTKVYGFNFEIIEAL